MGILEADFSTADDAGYDFTGHPFCVALLALSDDGLAGVVWYYGRVFFLYFECLFGAI